MLLPLQIYLCRSRVLPATPAFATEPSVRLPSCSLAHYPLLNSPNSLIPHSPTQLLAEDFQRKTLLVRAPRLWLRIGCYCALVLGVGCMAILGLWEAGEKHGGDEADADHDHARRMLSRMALA